MDNREIPLRRLIVSFGVRYYAANVACYWFLSIVFVIQYPFSVCIGKPALVHGLEGNRISRVACGSSHSVCWTTPEAPITSCHEPVLFTSAKDPLGAGFVTGTSNNSGRGVEAGVQQNSFDPLSESQQPSATVGGITSSTGYQNGHYRKSSANTTKASLSRIILSLESNALKQVCNIKVCIEKMSKLYYWYL